jgi:hypothetical protein
MLYPAKLSFPIDKGIKVFHDKLKLKKYMTTIPPLQTILKGIQHTEAKTNITMKGQEILNLKRTTDN